jgi:hypothetical protein
MAGDLPAARADWTAARATLAGIDAAENQVREIDALLEDGEAAG